MMHSTSCTDAALLHSCSAVQHVAADIVVHLLVAATEAAADHHCKSNSSRLLASAMHIVKAILAAC